MTVKRTLVLGASTNPQRYAYLAAKRLLAKGHPIILIGNKTGNIDGHPIQNSTAQLTESIDTITLYLSPPRQVDYYDYILQLQPNRVIFNPGTENQALMDLLDQHHITYQIACTLVLLSTAQY